MARLYGFEGPLAALAVASIMVGWAQGCGIDLSKHDLAGKPCKNGTCLPGYVCSQANVCVLDPGPGGTLGSGGSAAEGGTQGTGGSTEGNGGAGATNGASGTAGDAGMDVSVVPDAGEDQSSDASGGTGGSAGADAGDGPGGTAGSGGTAGDAGRWPGVGCLQLTCGPSEVCCVASYPGYPTPPPPAAFRCAAPGATCAYTVSCDGDHDCPTGQRCCVVNTAGGPVASCAANCGVPPYHVECTKPEHCGTGLVCCGVNFSLNRFESVSCRPGCNGFNDALFCIGDGGCPTGESCQNSAVVPGFKTCQ